MADQMVSNGKNMQDFTVGGTTSSGLTRERSFVRSNTQQNHHHNHQNKRRSLAFNQQSSILNQQQQQFQQDIQQQLRSKPAIEIYRPPSIPIPLK